MVRRTKIPKVSTTVRVPRRDKDAIYAIARSAGISQSQVLCDAIREKIERVALERVVSR